MKRLIIYPFFTPLVGLAWNSQNHFSKMDTWIDPAMITKLDTSHFDQDKALAELRKKIEGRENEPASEVYEDIQMFKQVPAVCFASWRWGSAVRWE